MVTTKLVLKLNKVDSSGKVPVYLRITHRRRHSYINTGVKIEPRLWDSSNSKTKSNYENARSANMLLKKLVFKAERIVHDFDIQGRQYTSQIIKEAVLEQNGDNLIQYIDNWIKLRRESKTISIGTEERYRSVLEKLSEHCNGQIRIDQFNIDFVLKFENCLQSKYKNKTNTVSSNLSMLRAVANSLVQEGKMKVDNNPFIRYKFKSEESKRGFLTSDQLSKLESVILPDGSKIAMSRDIFIFCSQTGFRIGDAMRQKKENFNGSHLIYYSQKTRTYDTLKLTSKARQAIAPYIEDSRPSNTYIFDFLNPRKQENEVSALKDQKSATSLINKNLGLIAKRAGLDMDISSHLGRHSMATLALLKGLSMEEIKAILNHRDIKTTQIYAKVVNSMKDNAIDKLDD